MPKLFFVVLSLVFYTCNAVASDDPLEFSRKGYIACGSPSMERIDKTCLVFSKFAFTKDGKIVETDEIAIAGPPLLTVVYPDQQLTAKGNSVCAEARMMPTIDNVVVKREGVALTKEEAGPLVETILAKTAALSGKRICEIYTSSGKHAKTKYEIDGKPIAGAGMTYIWLKEKGDYKLSPF